IDPVLSDEEDRTGQVKCQVIEGFVVVGHRTTPCPQLLQPSRSFLLVRRILVWFLVPSLHSLLTFCWVEGSLTQTISVTPFRVLSLRFISPTAHPFSSVLSAVLVIAFSSYESTPSVSLIFALQS